MPITQYCRQLVELTESSGGDGVSQVLASYMNLYKFNFTMAIIKNGSHNDAMMTSGYTGWKIPFMTPFCVDHNPSYDYGYNTMMISWFNNGQASVGWKIPHF